MTYFKNPIFMATIIKNQGATSYFQSAQVVPMLTALEMQTRLVLQAAIKFMKKDRRTKLQCQDIQMAAREIGHEDINLMPAPVSRMVKDGKVSIANLVDNCGFNLHKPIEKSEARGKIVYYKGKVIEDGRLQIRRLERLGVDSVLIKKKQAFNVISMAQGDSSMTKEQLDYISYLENELAMNNQDFDGKVEGRVRRFFHFYMHLIRRYPNEAGIKMLINLFNRRDIRSDHNIVIYNIPKIFEILMIYRGKWAYKVGEMIVELANNYQTYQPQLLNILSDEKDDYSYVIKATVFQFSTRIETIRNNLHFLIRKAKRQSFKGDEMAAFSLKLLMRNAEAIAAFYKQRTIAPVDLPNSYLHKDRYLSCY